MEEHYFGKVEIQVRFLLRAPKLVDTYNKRLYNSHILSNW
jgi:hypothetical protein